MRFAMEGQGTYPESKFKESDTIWFTLYKDPPGRKWSVNFNWTSLETGRLEKKTDLEER